MTGATGGRGHESPLLSTSNGGARKRILPATSADNRKLHKFFGVFFGLRSSPARY
jgi:hypothetical protein